MNEQTQREVEIGKHSRITLGVAWAILGVVVSGAVGGVVMYDELRAQVRELQASQMTRTDNLTWIIEFKNANPQLSVPVPHWERVALVTNSNVIMATVKP